MFAGSLVALVTPMTLSGAIDYQSLHTLVEWHLSQRTDGLVILGTTGESATIFPHEREKIIRCVVEQVASRIPIIVGTGLNATEQTIQLTRQAKNLGADAALLVTPYYNRPTQEGLFQHFSTVARAAPFPQILYNVPSRTAVDLLPATVARLAQACSNIVGIKEAVNTTHRIKDLTAALSHQLDVFSGDDATAMELILAGGKGVISVVANIKPKESAAMCRYALSGDRLRAQTYADQLKPFHEVLSLEANPIPIKWMLEEAGKISGGIRLPLTRLNTRFYQRVRQVMQA